MVRSRRKKKVRSSKSNLFSLYISPPTTTFSSKPPNHHHRAAAVLTAYLLCLQCTFLAQHLHIGNSLLLFKKKKRKLTLVLFVIVPATSSLFVFSITWDVMFASLVMEWTCREFFFMSVFDRNSYLSYSMYLIVNINFFPNKIFS